MGGGNVDQGFGTVQYGGNAGNKTDYRVYVKYLNQDHLPNSSGRDGGDGWHMLRGGFRTDSVFSSKDTLMFQGDIYSRPREYPNHWFPGRDCHCAPERRPAREPVRRFHPRRLGPHTRLLTRTRPYKFPTISTNATILSARVEARSTLISSTTSVGGSGRTLSGD